MKTISKAFENAINETSQEYKAYILLDGKKYEDDILSLKITEVLGERLIGNVFYKEVELELDGSYKDINGKMVEVYIGLKANGKDEYINIGTFEIAESSLKDEATDETKIIAKNKAFRLNEKMGMVSGGRTIAEIVGIAGSGMSSSNLSFQVEHDKTYDTKEEYYKDVAAALAANYDVDNDKFITLSKTPNYVINKANIFELKKDEHIMKPINTVVLSRIDNGNGETTDDIYARDDALVSKDGISEYKILQNQILDDDRQNGTSGLLTDLKGLTQNGVDIEIKLSPQLEIGDYLKLDNGTCFYVQELEHDYNGGITKIKSYVFTKVETDYKRASTSDKIKRTEIKVDKQEQKIEAVISDTKTLDGKIQENYAKTLIEINNITNRIQNANGTNLIKNSVMFERNNENKPTSWELQGNIDISTSQESVSAGCLSGNTFTLDSSTVKQRVAVKENATYSFSCKVKKDAASSGYIRLFNSNEDHKINLDAGKSYFYENVELTKLKSTMSYYDVELYGEGVSFTDLMLSLGEYASQWTQASGEVMSANAQFSINGLKIYRGEGFKDYTVMSPLEFSGYSEVNGQLIRAFTLNKDTTEVVKIKASKKIEMKPLKVVPIKTGEVQGWAFVQDE